MMLGQTLSSSTARWAAVAGCWFVGMLATNRVLAAPASSERLASEPFSFGDAGPVSIASPWSAYALSMVFQILFPILTDCLLRCGQWMTGQFAPRCVHLLAGYLSWKAGCDCGFFLVQGQDWQRAFHPAGLVPYTIVQFLCLYVVGGWLIDGRGLPFFRSDRPATPGEERIRKFLSRWFYEDGDIRSTDATIGQVLVKPLFVVVAASCSWPMHDIGMNIAERSDNSVVSIYANYSFRLLWLFTLGGYFGRIFFFNCGWLCYRGVLAMLGRSAEEYEAEREVKLETEREAEQEAEREAELEERLRKSSTDREPPKARRPMARDILLPLAGMATWKFVSERVVGVAGVAWLLPFLATQFADVLTGPAAPYEFPGLPTVRLVAREVDHEPDANQTLRIAVVPTNEAADDRIGFRVERLMERELAGLVRLTITGPDPIYYTTDGSIPAIQDGKPLGSTRLLRDRNRGLVFQDVAIVRAGIERDGAVTQVRSQGIVPNRWRVRLPALPHSLSGIRDVYVTGDFSGWSKELDPAFRLMRDDTTGEYSSEIQIDAETRTYYKFLLKYDADMPQWHLSRELPQGNDGAHVNHVITGRNRLAKLLRAERDGLLEEAGLSWERFQTDDEHERVALVLLAGDVEQVWLKFPKQKIGAPLTSAPHDKDGLPLVSYYGRIGCGAKPTGFCFLAKDRDRHWLVGPRGAWECAADDAGQDATLERMAAVGNVFESLRSPSTTPGEDMRGRVVYFAMVDRFVDGNPDNNAGDKPELYARPESPAGADPLNPRNPNLYWGGDVAGLTQKVPYLKSLGIGTLWSTPLVKNIPWMEESQLPHKASYHGYWAYDFFEIDGRLGTWDELGQLTKSLDEADMEFMLDFVPNHSSPAYMMDGGRLLREGVEVVKSFAHDAQIVDPKEQFYHHYSMTTTPAEERRAPDRYLRSPWMLSDFNHGNPRVDNYLIEAAQKWVEKGATALRLDSLKHNDPDFLRRFCKSLNEFSLKQNERPLFIVGEWFGGGLFDRASLDFVNRTDHCELLDFGMKYRLFDAMAGDGFENLDRFLRARRDAFRGRESWQLTFLDNHDTKRARVELEDPLYGRGMSPPLVLRRLDQGMVLLLTLPGIPVINYGTELYLADSKPFWFGSHKRVGDEPANRLMMPDNFEDEARKTPMFAIIQKLSALRRASLAVQRAPYETIVADKHGLVFQRAAGDHVLLVAVNQGPARDVAVTGLQLPDGVYADRLSPSVKLTVRDGSATIRLPDEGALVFHSGD